MKKSTLIAVALLLSACSNDADVVSNNLSTAADQFQINRRIIFYNGITGDYMISIEGFCSLGNSDKPKELSVTCKTGPGSYRKDFLGLSDNVTYFAEQIEPTLADPYHYIVIFKPSSIVPNIELK